jgi:hypothetical protein
MLLFLMQIQQQKKNPKSSWLVVITVQPKIKKTFESKLYFVFILRAL